MENQSGADALDSRTRELLDEVLQEAYNRGFREGVKHSQGQILDSLEHLVVPALYTEDDFKLPHSTVNLHINTESDIDVIRLSERPRNCLRRVQITTLGELTKKSADDLLGIINFGQRSFDEVVEKFVEYELIVPDGWRDAYNGSLQLP